MLRKIMSLGAAAGVCAALIGAPGAAAAAPYTWGQEVKACNETSCYPGGTSRGAYVEARARDARTPGYAWEVQAWALGPRGLGNGGF